ncbi:MAG: DUF1987 domain-containing protein [Syntrophobacteraceae bacterium]
METLRLEATASTPLVLFDPGAGVFEIRGESYPENSMEFYRPVVDWLVDYLDGFDGRFVLTVDTPYLNSSSVRYMMDLLDALESVHGAGKNVAVEWFCDEENERAFETAKELGEDMSFPFNIIEKKL